MKQVCSWGCVFGLALSFLSSGAAAGPRPEQLNCFLEGAAEGTKADCTVIATKCSFEPSDSVWGVENASCAAVSIECENAFRLSDPGAAILRGKHGTAIEAVEDTVRVSKSAVLSLQELRKPQTYRARLHTSVNDGEELGYFEGQCVLSLARDDIEDPSGY